MNSFHIRPAVDGDAPFAADMLQLSLGGLGDHLFGTDRQTSRGYVEKLVARNAGRFALRFAFIFPMDGVQKGALFACPGKLLDRLNMETSPHLFLVLGFSPAIAFIRRGLALPGGVEAEDDEYYIGNIGVHPSAQGQGIGSALLNFAEEQARKEGLPKCSLIVGSYNQDALRLYQRHGYEVVETVTSEHPSLGYHRMVKVL